MQQLKFIFKEFHQVKEANIIRYIVGHSLNDTVVSLCLGLGMGEMLF